MVVGGGGGAVVVVGAAVVGTGVAGVTGGTVVPTGVAGVVVTVGGAEEAGADEPPEPPVLPETSAGTLTGASVGNASTMVWAVGTVEGATSGGSVVATGSVVAGSTGRAVTAGSRTVVLVGAATAWGSNVGRLAAEMTLVSPNTADVVSPVTRIFPPAATLTRRARGAGDAVGVGMAASGVVGAAAVFTTVGAGAA